jgi:hypothetical protein
VTLTQPERLALLESAWMDTAEALGVPLSTISEQEFARHLDELYNRRCGSAIVGRQQRGKGLRGLIMARRMGVL